MRFKITLHGKPLGITRLIDEGRVDPLEHTTNHSLNFSFNRAYFCPQCGDNWAKWELEGEWRQWHSLNRSCGIHAKGLWHGDRPGSLMLYPGDIIVASREVLEYELLRQSLSIEELASEPTT